MIHLKDVTKIYKDNNVLALDKVSLDIERGEFVFIVGTSGSGKSTLMKLLMHEEVATSGSIVVNGKDVTKLKPKEIPYLRRNLGVIFQDYRLLEDKTVYENVAFAMQVIEAPRRIMQRSVNTVLDIVGLRDKFKSFPAQLSGGEPTNRRATSTRKQVGTSWIFFSESTRRARRLSWRRTIKQSSTKCSGALSQSRAAKSLVTRFAASTPKINLNNLRPSTDFFKVTPCKKDSRRLKLF